MAYPLSTSIHLYFNDGLTLDEQIVKHTDAGFRYLDFNFLDWQNVKDSPLLGDGWEAWIASARETAVFAPLVTTIKSFFPTRYGTR